MSKCLLGVMCRFYSLCFGLTRFILPGMILGFIFILTEEIYSEAQAVISWNFKIRFKALICSTAAYICFCLHAAY